VAAASAGPYAKLCTSLQTDNHASIPPLSFLQAKCPSCHPTNSVKALKAYCSSETLGWILMKFTICNYIGGMTIYTNPVGAATASVVSGICDITCFSLEIAQGKGQFLGEFGVSHCNQLAKEASESILFGEGWRRSSSQMNLGRTCYCIFTTCALCCILPSQ